VLRKKSFAETHTNTKHFQEKYQTTVFNTNDNIPQIKYVIIIKQTNPVEKNIKYVFSYLLLLNYDNSPHRIIITDDAFTFHSLKLTLDIQLNIKNLLTRI
jgi:hypothetical protein